MYLIVGIKVEPIVNFTVEETKWILGRRIYDRPNDPVTGEPLKEYKTRKEMYKIADWVFGLLPADVVMHLSREAMNDRDDLDYVMSELDDAGFIDCVEDNLQGKLIRVDDVIVFGNRERDKTYLDVSLDKLTRVSKEVADAAAKLNIPGSVDTVIVVDESMCDN